MTDWAVECVNGALPLCVCMCVSVHKYTELTSAMARKTMQIYLYIRTS